MLTPILPHLTVFRLDYHANKYLARISTTPASHRPRRYLRHCRPTRSNRRHAQIRIQTGPDVLPLVNLPHDRAGHRFRRAVPIQDSRLPILALADRSLLDIVVCGVDRDAHPDQASGGKSLLRPPVSAVAYLSVTLICIHRTHPIPPQNRPCSRRPNQHRSTSPSPNALTLPTPRRVEPSTNPAKQPKCV